MQANPRGQDSERALRTTRPAKKGLLMCALRKQNKDPRDLENEHAAVHNPRHVNDASYVRTIPLVVALRYQKKKESIQESFLRSFFSPFP